MRAALQGSDHAEAERDVVHGIGHDAHDLVLQFVNPHHSREGRGDAALTSARPGAGSRRKADANDRLGLPHVPVFNHKRLGVEHVTLDGRFARPRLGRLSRAIVRVGASRGGKTGREAPVLRGQVGSGDRLSGPLDNPPIGQVEIGKRIDLGDDHRTRSHPANRIQSQFRRSFGVRKGVLCEPRGAHPRADQREEGFAVGQRGALPRRHALDPGQHRRDDRPPHEIMMTYLLP
jgi:hypothetical protein